ncbi:hypothetical protein [Nonomuraea sediminis]|uniref:hypothetical protein n=1 Tax=Nonomuraea sediminis TaxID=2835864 RepID=UPI001BDC1A7E|nr:hypothetical protein [Nonomuraea sediminis]
MSDGYPTAAQREALQIICDHPAIDSQNLSRYLVAARRTSSNPGYAKAIARMAGMLAWRLESQGFINETNGMWATTAQGRTLVGCTGEPA